MCFPVQQTTVRDGPSWFGIVHLFSTQTVEHINQTALGLYRTTRYGFEPGHHRVLLSIHTGYSPDRSVS